MLRLTLQPRPDGTVSAHLVRPRRRLVEGVLPPAGLAELRRAAAELRAEDWVLPGRDASFCHRERGLADLFQAWFLQAPELLVSLAGAWGEQALFLEAPELWDLPWELWPAAAALGPGRRRLVRFGEGPGAARFERKVYTVFCPEPDAAELEDLADLGFEGWTRVAPEALPAGGLLVLLARGCP